MRVLVIEDELSLAAGLKRGLEPDGFAVDVAANGIDGLWMAREHPYDAIILDIMLPGLNGYEVCAALRADGNWVPVLMLTAKDGEFDEAEALDTGADDYLTKPFSYVVLLARLRALLRRGSRERPVVIEVGDLRLDPASRRVWRGDSEIGLTVREFALLEFLMRRQEEVVSKQDILNHVWDFGFDGDPNIVEVYVRRLRHRLGLPYRRSAGGAGSAAVSIETLRGAGYRLAAYAS